MQIYIPLGNSTKNRKAKAKTSTEQGKAKEDYKQSA